MGALHPYLKQIAAGETLTSRDMEGAVDVVFSGEADDIEIAGLLMGLASRGETASEIAGAARAMRDRAVKIEAPGDVIDTCGTGGDGAHTYNISTAAAIVAAAAGAKVAKHGNKATSSKSGSSDVLKALGLNLEASPEQVSHCLSETGIGFLFAPKHHGATANVAKARSTLGVRTIFNLLGPLSNPAGARRQVLGVYSKRLLTVMAEALLELGADHVMVIHGSDGLDELTTTGPSFVSELKNGQITSYEVTPEDVGLSRAQPEDLRGGTADENATALRDILNGTKNAYRDIVLLNAAAALRVAGVEPTLADGVKRAAVAIDSGAGLATLEALVAQSHQSAAE